MVDWVESAVRSTKLFDVERIGDNLIISLGSGRPYLFMNSHSDVVPVSDTFGASNFEPYEKDGAIWGRGATDAKGCGTAMLLSLIKLANEGWSPGKGRVSFALTVCEETSGDNNGMAELRAMMDAGILELPDAAIIGEPTSLRPCIAQKGLLVVKLLTKGDSGHAARVYGDNAVYHMAKVLTELEKISFNDSNEFLGNTKITPTKITGGSVHNVMAEQVETVVDIRTIPEVPNNTIISELRTRLNCEVSVHSDRFVSTATDRENRLVKIAIEVTGHAPFGSPTASDWVFLSDVPTVKLGPGHSELSHKPNEHIHIDQLEQGIVVYKELIKRYFLEVET